MPKREIDVELSRQLSEAIGAVNKECFLNAFRGLSHYPEGQYVEGYVLVRVSKDSDEVFPMPILHAWIEVDGKIIDPTPVYGQKGHAEYFPGNSYSLMDAIKKIEDNDNILPINDDNMLDPRDPKAKAIMDARNDAERYLYGGKTMKELLTQTPQIKEEVKQIVDEAITLAVDRAEVEMGISFDYVDPTIYEKMSAATFSYIYKMDKELAEKLDEVIRDSKSYDEVASRIRDEVEPFYEGRAEAIAITELSRVSSLAYSEIISRSGLKGDYRFHVSDDDKVCDECFELDGQVVEPTAVPVHPRCRCWTTFEIGEGEIE